VWRTSFTDGIARVERCARECTRARSNKANGNVRGIAVHIGARIAAAARPGEVLVSSTVKDIVAGSGISFEERGEHQLDGVPGTWRLFTARI
jgi:class 3 adenylate cyclase